MFRPKMTIRISATPWKIRNWYINKEIFIKRTYWIWKWKTIMYHLCLMLFCHINLFEIKILKHYNSQCGQSFPMCIFLFKNVNKCDYNVNKMVIHMHWSIFLNHKCIQNARFLKISVFHVVVPCGYIDQKWWQMFGRGRARSHRCLHFSILWIVYSEVQCPIWEWA